MTLAAGVDGRRGAARTRRRRARVAHDRRRAPGRQRLRRSRVDQHPLLRGGHRRDAPARVRPCHRRSQGVRLRLRQRLTSRSSRAGSPQDRSRPRRAHARPRALRPSVRSAADLQPGRLLSRLSLPICAKYLLELGRLLPEYAQRGVSVVAISSDGEARAREMARKINMPALRMGYALPLSSGSRVGPVHHAGPRQDLDRHRGTADVLGAGGVSRAPGPDAVLRRGSDHAVRAAALRRAADLDRLRRAAQLPGARRVHGPTRRRRPSLWRPDLRTERRPAHRTQYTSTQDTRRHPCNVVIWARWRSHCRSPCRCWPCRDRCNPRSRRTR